MDEVQQLWQLLQQDAHLLSAFQKKGNMGIEVHVLTMCSLLVSLLHCVLCIVHASRGMRRICNYHLSGLKEHMLRLPLTN